MKTILDSIIIEKQKEVKTAKQNIPLAQIRLQLKKEIDTVRDFKGSIHRQGHISIIGELKKQSPVKGILRKQLPLIKTARIYEKEKINAISVLTDKHFLGKLADLKKVRNAVSLPVLRKDFIIDEYQIYESRLAQADAILLIAAILSKTSLSKMLRITRSLGMAALVEVHDEADLKKLNFKEIDIIGINNRNLNNFLIDIKTTQRLIKKIPADKTIVSESGISDRKQINLLKKSGANAVLIGEGIVRSRDIAARIRFLQRRK